MSLSIDIYDGGWVKVATLFDIKYLSLKSSFSGIVYSELHVPRKAVNITELQLTRRLIIKDTRHPSSFWTTTCCIIDEIVNNQEDDFITYHLKPLKAILKQRVTINTVNDVQEFSNTQAYVMEILVRYNASEDISTPGRNFPGLSVQVLDNDQVVGVSTVGQQMAWSYDGGSLADNLTSVAMLSDIPLGWDIKPVMGANGILDGNMMYSTIKSPEKQIGNAQGNTPVLFSDMKGDFVNATSVFSNKDYIETAYGYGKNNTQVGLLSAGFSRYEADINSSHSSHSSQKDELWSEIKKRKDRKSFTAELSQTSQMIDTYGTQWKLGDKVTVYHDLITETADERIKIISEIEEVYEGDSYELHVVFGDIRKGYNQALRTSLREWKGQRQYDKVSGKLLWSGALYPSAANTINLAAESGYDTSWKLSECKKGWKLIWSNYTVGSGPDNWDWVTTYVPHNSLLNLPHVYPVPVSSVQSVNKILKFTDTTIQGYDENDDAPANTAVLREVRIW